MKHLLVLLCVLCFTQRIGAQKTAPPFPSSNAGTLKDVLHVEGRFLYDANGEKVVIRGIEEFQNNSIDEISRTGANAYRMVYSTDAEELDRLLYKAVAECNMIVSVMVSGSYETVSDWNKPDVKAVLKNYESHLVLHAYGEGAYEAGAAGATARWLLETKEVIRLVRSYGYRCPLEILSNGWGQNLLILLDHGREVIDSDPLKNIILGCQMYADTRPDGYNGMTIEEAMKAIARSGLPIQLGACPFTGADCKPLNNAPPDNWIRVWKGTHENGIGCYYWCWSGSPSWLPACDGLSRDGSYGNWTAYGVQICGSGPYSTARTSKKIGYPLANRPPMVIKKFKDTMVGAEVRELNDYANVREFFHDYEDGIELSCAVRVSDPNLLSAAIDEKGNVDLKIPEGSVGTCRVEVVATDSGGISSGGGFTVVLQDPRPGNAALHKSARASSVEGGCFAAYAVDGREDTRWGSLYSDDQWLAVDLGGMVLVDRVRLIWEAAFGAAYDIQVSSDMKSWKTVVEEKNGDGGIDDFPIAPASARYVKMRGIKRGTPWGYSLFEIQVHKRE